MIIELSVKTKLLNHNDSIQVKTIYMTGKRVIFILIIMPLDSQIIESQHGQYNFNLRFLCSIKEYLKSQYFGKGFSTHIVHLI